MKQPTQALLALTIVLGVSLADAKEPAAYTNAVRAMIELPTTGTNLAIIAAQLAIDPHGARSRGVFRQFETNTDISSLYLSLSTAELRALGFSIDSTKQTALLNRMLQGESPITMNDVTVGRISTHTPTRVSGALELSVDGIIKARLFFTVRLRDSQWVPERLDVWNPHISDLVPLFDWTEKRRTLADRFRESR